MSGLGESAEDIKHNALSLIEHQIMVTGNTPVGVLTAQEVKKIDDPVWEKVVDHVRLFGEESVCLVSDQDYNVCGVSPEEPERFYVGSTLVATIEYQGTERAYFIMHSPVPKNIFDEFISEVSEKSRIEKEARQAANEELEEEDGEFIQPKPSIDLTKLREDVEDLRGEIEEAALERCKEIRLSADGSLVGYVTSEEKFGYQHDTFSPLEGDPEDAYREIRGGASPVFSGEHKTLRNVCEEYVREKHYLGSIKIGQHAVDRSDKSNVKTKQFFIFDRAVTLNDFHRFLYRLKKLTSKHKVHRDKKEVENIYWAGKPKKKSAEVPVFGFD